MMPNTIRPNPLKADPTRTKTQRMRLERDINRRLNRLKREVTDLIVTQDVFGMRVPKGPTANTVWQFLTREQQLTEFTSWLKTQVAITVLAKAQTLGQMEDDHWLRGHIESTYRKGMLRSFDLVKRPELQENLDFFNGTKAQFLNQSFNRPVSIQRVKLLASRSFNELNGVTDSMATQMQKTLVDGFIQGKNPKAIARDLHRDVDGIGKKRARMIAHTEVVRAHNEGQLDALEDLGVTDIGVSVEWQTSGLGLTARGNLSPCRLCAPLKGVVLKTSEAHGMLPRHPNCRCSYIPANVGEDTEGQKRTRSRITKAIDASLRAERPKKKISLAQVKKKSRWVGSQTSIAKKRPESII